MRRALWVLAAGVVVLSWASGAGAQVNGIGGSNGDPFFLYYGWYLPQQAALANQPRVQDTIQANVAANQAYATTNRSNLYDPNGGYGRFNPYAAEGDVGAGVGGAARVAGAGRMRSSVPTSNIRGQGPPLYYNRTAQHYPSMRVGQGPNRNLAVAGRGARRTAGVPSMPSMPGPR